MKNIKFETDDWLNRKADALNLMSITNVIKNSVRDNNSISIALNAKWGDGKTYLLRMWKNFIESGMDSRNDKSIYYNVWEYDDCDTTLLPLVYNIMELSNEEEDINFIEHAKLFIKMCGIATLKYSVKKVLGDNVEIADAINSGIDTLSDTGIKSIVNEYNQYYNKRSMLLQGLRDIIPNNGTLWVFVDELDRCRPDFAIKTLETIKHFFDIENIVFVFSLDLEQLEKTVCNYYGHGINVNSYLRKFFDFIYNLTSPDIDRYLNHKFNMSDSFSLLGKNSKNSLKLLFVKFEFSLRDIDITINNVIFFLEKYKHLIERCEDKDVTLQVYLYFIVIKVKFNEDYLKIIHGRFLIDKEEKSRWKPIDKKYFVGSTISNLLADISGGKADKATLDLIERYRLFNIPDITVFSKHMELLLSYNADFNY